MMNIKRGIAFGAIGFLLSVGLFRAGRYYEIATINHNQYDLGYRSGYHDAMCEVAKVFGITPTKLDCK